MDNKINQVIEFKSPINVMYEKWGGTFASIQVVKVYVLRSGKPSFVFDEHGDKYDFERVIGKCNNVVNYKDLIYRTIIRNLMFKELI